MDLTNPENELSSDIDNISNIIDINSFSELDLQPELQDAITRLGWEQPTPVQQECLPHSLVGGDIAGFAQTGTGKTGVFLITVAQRILELRKTNPEVPMPYCVILVPTRELAIQISQDAHKLYEDIGISALAIFGGMDYEKQRAQLAQGADVIVATPGRLTDFFNKNVVNLENCKVFICDEADRLLEMGFVKDVEFFLRKVDPKSQKMFFSATTNERVKELAFQYLENPKYIEVSPEVITPENIKQKFLICESKNKLKVMLGLLNTEAPSCCVIFTNTKAVAEWLHFKLSNNNLPCELITGDLPQKKRLSLIQKIKDDQIKALIATDVASRGLHISQLSHVFNFDLPDDPNAYIHRIGRTARAGAEGIAISLVCEDYGQNLEGIKSKLKDQNVQCEWHDEAFLEIEDKAPNPVRQRRDRPDQRGGRGDSRDRGGRNDRGDRGRPQQGKPSRGPGASRPQGQGQRPDRDGQQRRKQGAHDRQERVVGAASAQVGARPEGRDHKRPRNRGRGKDRDRPRQEGAPNQHREPMQQAALAKTKAVESTPTTITGLLKKMFKSIFKKDA